METQSNAFLGTEKVSRLMRKFALPCVISQLVGALYNIVDQIYIANASYLGSYGNAANTVVFPLTVVALAIALFSSTIAYYAMWLRRYMVDENNKDYVKLARAKGVNESKITMRHVFRNAFVPMIQYIPTSLMYTVCGSIYIESLYSIPGMGGLLVDVISRQDNPMVQAIVMIYSCIGIVGLILGDLLMVLVDPRISLHGKGDAR